MSDYRAFIDRATLLAVPGQKGSDLDSRDRASLLKSYRIAEESRSAFLNGAISFPEYLELLELHQINIDQYLETIEFNLEQLRLI